MMLKKLSLLLLFVGVTTASNAQIKTPQPSPISKLEQVVGLTNVTLEYSRPGMKGRAVFGDLVPYDQTWRTGANANTKITFDTNVTIDGKELQKGTYAIYSVPNKESWEIIFYSDSNNSGLPKKWDDTKIALKTTVEAVKMPVKIETFTMTFDDLTTKSGVLGILWENIYVGVKFEVPTDALTTKSIETAMAGPSTNDYFQAATYYHTEGKDLKQAFAWMQKATAGENAPFWYLRRMSLIQADLGDKKGAIASAQKSLTAAEKANNADYVKMNKESIAAWQK